MHRKEACADVRHEASARVEDLDGSAIAAVLINVCMEYLKCSSGIARYLLTHVVVHFALDLTGVDLHMARD